MKYKIDTYEDFLKLKPVEVNNIFENFELYSDEEMNNLMNFVAKFEVTVPNNSTSILNENSNINIFETYTNNEIMTSLKNE